MLAFVGPLFPNYKPLDTATALLEEPSDTHPFGTDELGRDILSRVVAALRLDLFIALVAVSAAAVIGTTVGAMSGYIGGRVDDVVMRMIDIIMTFPLLLLAMGLVAFLGAGLRNLIVAMVVVNIPIFARLVRGDILARKQLEYVAAAQCSGCSGLRILARHLLPNAAGPLIVQASLALAWAVLNAAALSFLGLGVRPPAPELGLMVAEGANYLSTGAWWVSVYPGAVIVVIVFGFNLVGDGLQERLDPRREAV
ncbi:MAG: ABC transporter permease [Dehalococcoidia bacterium]